MKTLREHILENKNLNFIIEIYYKKNRDEYSWNYEKEPFIYLQKTDKKFICNFLNFDDEYSFYGDFEELPYYQEQYGNVEDDDFGNLDYIKCNFEDFDIENNVAKISVVKDDFSYEFVDSRYIHDIQIVKNANGNFYYLLQQKDNIAFLVDETDEYIVALGIVKDEDSKTICWAQGMYFTERYPLIDQNPLYNAYEYYLKKIKE